MDGKPDLFLMGVNEFSDNILNELYINNGNFLEQTLQQFFHPFLQAVILGEIMIMMVTLI